MIYDNLSTLGNNILNIGDIVYFYVNDKQLKYSVQSNHLSNVHRGNNDEIFLLLKLDKYVFCYTNYGYAHKGGDWPTCKQEDYRALTRVVIALYQEIEKKEVREIPKYYIGHIVTEELKAELNDTFNESVTSKVPEKKESTSSNIITKRKSKVKRIIGEEPIQLNNY